MRLPRCVQRWLALGAIAIGGGCFAASVDGVAQVGSTLEAPAPQQVRFVDCPGHHHRVDLRKL